MGSVKVGAEINRAHNLKEISQDRSRTSGKEGKKTTGVFAKQEMKLRLVRKQDVEKR